MGIRVAVQHQQRLFREGLGQLLASEDSIEVVGTAESDDQMAELCEQHRPESVLIDADATDWDPCQLAVRLSRRVKGLRIVGLSTASTSDAVRRARRAGMSALLPRQGGMGPIVTALRDQQVSGLRKLSVLPTNVDPGNSRGLTPREKAVLALIGSGFTARRIAEELQISYKTVENHKQRIFAKLGVQNQAHAISLAIRGGLIAPDRMTHVVANLTRVNGHRRVSSKL